jgi:hypothetical protein
MWIFSDDFGFINNNAIIFMLLYFFILVLVIFRMPEKYTKPYLFGIGFNIIYWFFVFFIFSKISPDHIPQYGTQSQKEMLAFCIKKYKNNELTEEEQKYISKTIRIIMSKCYTYHLMNKEIAKRQSKEQKQELKDKEILDSLNKMLIEKGDK